MRERILNDIKEAMKAQDKELLSVIRMVKGAMQLEEINLKRELNDDEVKILYLYAKNYWREFYKGYPKDLIEELKEKLRPQTFKTLYKIYIDLKQKLN